MVTRFEATRVIGARALQLSLGAPVLIKLPRGVDERDTLTVARYELGKGVVPIVIVRSLPRGEKEIVEIKL
ncbi:MAG: DNA-directed RNA polymerase subunit K [Candidatus Altiarchaeota archaeon]|nr:DNA-directed RNA polymerase subunit K [Candidatus Altiarchaeota archaeon]